MADTILIDGNSIGHANHNGTILTVGDFETQAIFGTIKSVRALLESNRGWSNLVLWDGRAQWRFDLYPEYKSNRAAVDAEAQARKDSYKRQVPLLRKALQMLGVRQMLVTSAEADDMAGLLSGKISDAGSRVLLVSGDQDWLQLVNSLVQWYDPIRDRRVGRGNFFEATGYKTPEQFLDGKILQGDGSDCISPVGGIGKGTAPEFLAEFGSVANFYAQVDSGVFVPKKKVHARLCGTSPFSREEWIARFEGDPSDTKALNKYIDTWPGQGRTLYERNRKLMNLLDVPTPPKEDVQITPGTFNPEGFRALCQKLCFHSILREFDAFIEPFEPIKAALAA